MSKFFDKIKSLTIRRKIIYFIFVPLIIGLLVSGLTYWYWKSSTTNPPERILTLEEKINEGVFMSLSGSSQEAISYYDKEINSSKDNKEKALLLMSKATIYFNDKDYTNALQTTLEADALNSTENSNQFLAKIYVILGEKSKAIERYKKAIDLIDNEDTMASFTKRYYESKIRELEK